MLSTSSTLGQLVFGFWAISSSYDMVVISFSNKTLVELKLGAKSEGFFKLRHLRCLTIICVKPLLLHQLSTKCVLHFPNLIIFFCETLIAFSTAEKLHTYIWKFFKCCWCPHSMLKTSWYRYIIDGVEKFTSQVEIWYMFKNPTLSGVPLWDQLENLMAALGGVWTIDA